MAEHRDPLRWYEERKKTREPFLLRPGFEVRVHTRLTEGGKERMQAFEGLVTAVTGSGLSKTFTVRRVAGGIAVERIFPMFSPLTTSVDILRVSKVRRARLTYLRRSAARKRRKEDVQLLQKVRKEQEATRRAKEEAEQGERAAGGEAQARVTLEPKTAGTKTEA